MINQHKTRWVPFLNCSRPWGPGLGPLPPSPPCLHSQHAESTHPAKAVRHRAVAREGPICNAGQHTSKPGRMIHGGD